MKKILMMLLVMILGLSVFAAEKVQFTLSRVYDGDTIEIINENNKKEVIRLTGIDCFETITKNIYTLFVKAKITIKELLL